MSGTETAIAASRHPILLDTPAQLARARKAWRKCSILAIDTEFVRERTYWAQPGLFQISDGHTAWLVDPVAIRDLRQLSELFADGSITKIFHSPSEDLDMIWHSLEVVPQPMVDTQLACAMLGQGLQLGYHKAVHWLLGVEVAKDQTRSNWIHRPLNPAQLRYAALDVVLLPQMWSILQERLDELGRRAWLEEEMSQLLMAVQRPLEPNHSYLRVKGASRLSAAQLPRLQHLAAWREVKALEQDIPRGFVVRDNSLIQVVAQQPQSLDELKSIDGIHGSSLRKFGAELLSVCQQVGQAGNGHELSKPLADVERRMLRSMRQVCTRLSDEWGIDPALLASKKELENLLRCLDAGDNPPARFTGWRYEILTRELLGLYHDGGKSKA